MWTIRTTFDYMYIKVFITSGTFGNMLRIHYLFTFWTLRKVFKNSVFEGSVFSWLNITEIMLNVPLIRYHKSCSHWNLSLFWQGGQGQETKELDYILLVSQLLLFLLQILTKIVLCTDRSKLYNSQVTYTLASTTYWQLIADSNSNMYKV